jgi:hypothetical protein
VKYVVEMSSGAMIYISNFIKTGSAIQKLIGAIHSHTDSMKVSKVYIFQNKENTLKSTGNRVKYNIRANQ